MTGAKRLARKDATGATAVRKRLEKGSPGAPPMLVPGGGLGRRYPAGPGEPVTQFIAAAPMLPSNARPGAGRRRTLS